MYMCFNQNVSRRHFTPIAHFHIACMVLTVQVVTMNEYIETDEELIVTVKINKLCLNDTNYLVQVIFGTRPIGNDDCIDQEESGNKTLSSGDSEIFSVSIDSIDLQDDYEYCYTIIVNGKRGK